MIRCVAAVLAVLTLFACSAAAHAQDGGRKEPKVVQDFAQVVQLAPDKKPAAEVDVRLLEGFVNKLAACYRAETQQPLAAADRALLVEYAPDLVSQFSAALRGTTCDPKRPATDQCLVELGKLPCEPFAQVVRNNKWDLRLSPEMEAAVAKYTTKLAARYMACGQGATLDDEEAKVRTDYGAQSGTVQVSMLLTTGQCSLHLPKLETCLQRIEAADACKSMQELAKRSRLPRYCNEFLDCSAEPALVDAIQ